jgi:predicted  nucleic acid-binding Zn ribbon protein
MGGRITKIQSLSKDQMRMMMKLNSIKAGSVKKKKKAKEEQTFIVDEARLEAQKNLKKLIAMRFKVRPENDQAEEKATKDAAQIRKELILQALLGNNYLCVPLKKHYLVELPFEPMRKQVIAEKDDHNWICLVDEEKAKKQGALYRTDLVTKLSEDDKDLVKRQKQLQETLNKLTNSATFALRIFGNQVINEKDFNKLKAKKLTR